MISPRPLLRHLARLGPLALGILVVGLVLCVWAAEPVAAEQPAGSDPVGVWPLRPEPDVVATFDPPVSPYAPGHRGVDLAGAVGQRVLAALPGTITYAGPLAGRGVVVISHGATRTTYQPVEAVVGVGDVVAAGDPVGRLDLAGSHCLPRACLHWGWIEGETYLDPLRLVGAGPVRLLPLWGELSMAPTPPSGSPATSGRPSSPYDAWQPLLRALHHVAAS